jgi:hypothetical protein
MDPGAFPRRLPIRTWSRQHTGVACPKDNHWPTRNRQNLGTVAVDSDHRPHVRDSQRRDNDAAVED